MKFVMKQVAVAAAMSGAMLVAGTNSAFAAPLFTVNPTGLSGGSGASFVADTVNGISSELLHLTPTGAVASAGWLQFNGFSNSTTPINIGAGTSRLTVDYNMYLLFDLTTTYLGGGSGNGTAGAHYNINTLNFALYADPLRNTAFSAANSTGVGTEAVVTSGFAPDDILLAVGSLISGAPNSADLTAGGGAALNAITSFGVCQGSGNAKFGGLVVGVAGCVSNAGANYFVAPNPFYQLAFSGFNNAGGGVLKNGNLVSINNAAAAITFNNVPEPGSLALLGIGLAGLGLSARRRKIGK